MVQNAFKYITVDANRALHFYILVLRVAGIVWLGVTVNLVFFCVPVLCGDDALLACDSEWTYCLQQNKTRQAECVPSCLLQNGNCEEERICITNPGLRPALECVDRDGTWEVVPFVCLLTCLILSLPVCLSPSLSLLFSLSPCLFSLRLSLYLSPSPSPSPSPFLLDFSGECPPGMVMKSCGNVCQLTCEGLLTVTNSQEGCRAFCDSAECGCPHGLALFRDRCVDPKLCYILLQSKGNVRNLLLIDSSPPPPLPLCFSPSSPLFSIFPIVCAIQTLCRPPTSSSFA